MVSVLRARGHMREGETEYGVAFLLAIYRSLEALGCENPPKRSQKVVLGLLACNPSLKKVPKKVAISQRTLLRETDSLGTFQPCGGFFETLGPQGPGRFFESFRGFRPGGPLGNGRNAVSRVLFRITEPH